MTKTVFYLKTCSTCKRIMQDLDLSGWNLREIKSEPINEEELSQMYAITKSYEELFSKRSTQIKANNIDVKELKEDDFKTFLLQHYSFLKRPVFLIENKDVYIGNSSKTIEALQQKYF
ncbi:arsenate reductase family protein [Riemerella anatipestifer]|uniref:arsenate reductase family protein n=1 Tax=Riemerella anatipestifer TaxID=34085 RepID=UPI00069BCC9F|nr:ArsC/Spx/MgsR family protein [Riemerella anatipestifer]MDY3343925.1 arsenate reductase family protein [Riemerella anatipestifer]MDY3350909.1 arsenate reductase family protein [Riemerella anatipestifer]MDY3357005.1 arsenate reductase family protein [Riemerella anatipestifer]MDY3529355.1 arsenate reductase family protein [Riemerella anatipestifer]MDY3537070.1 arsenate reductase family protein [Riemerella anatipestifer]